MKTKDELLEAAWLRGIPTDGKYKQDLVETLQVRAIFFLYM